VQPLQVLRAFDFRLPLKAGDHFPHQHHDIPPIGAVADVVASAGFIAEREHHQDEAGFARIAFCVAVE
jgi:hypothetical protein